MAKNNSTNKVAPSVNNNNESNQASQIAALQQSSKIQQQGRMLRNDEIKEICEKHGLSRQEVYQLRSQFASMCMLSESWNQEDQNTNVQT